jgi:hypothetical protein
VRVKRQRANSAQDRGELPSLPLAHSPESVLVEVTVSFAKNQIDRAVNQFLNQMPPGAHVSLVRTEAGYRLTAADAEGDPLDTSLDLSIDLAR